MDEMVEEGGLITVGERLRQAREAAKMSIEDVAAATRIPTRHLQSLEVSEWDKLPAPTYSIGFAKNYASAVGLDRNEIGEALRSEMGGSRPVMAAPELYETNDPARTMPKGLIFGALALLALVVLGLTWLNNRTMSADSPPSDNVAEVSNVAVAPPPAPTVTGGPVTVTATDAVWVDIKDGGVTLKQGELKAGESFAVPPTALAPTITTGKPEALRITVGDAVAPAIGPAGQRASDVSLKGDDLLKAPTAAAPGAPAPVANAAPAAPSRSAPARSSRPTPSSTKSAAPSPTTPTNASEPAPAAANPGTAAPSAQPQGAAGEE